MNEQCCGSTSSSTSSIRCVALIITDFECLFHKGILHTNNTRMFVNIIVHSLFYAILTDNYIIDKLHFYILSNSLNKNPDEMCFQQSINKYVNMYNIEVH